MLFSGHQLKHLRTPEEMAAYREACIGEAVSQGPWVTSRPPKR
jgi:hypothetical protein